MIKIINDRLTRVSDHLLNTDNILDIGCDHALLEIYLCLKYPNLKIIGSDINAKPLLIAKDNVSKYHLEDRIKLIQADGLEKMDGNVDTLVISGMGSITMINILNNINYYPNIKKIVLSPNNDFNYLRDKMNKLEFKIESEEIIKDKNKYYLVIAYEKGKEKIDSYFGKLDLNNPINKEYFLKIVKTNDNLLSKITDEKKKIELKKENKRIISKLKKY